MANAGPNTNGSQVRWKEREKTENQGSLFLLSLTLDPPFSGKKKKKFFVCTVRTDFLDGKHVVFGQLVEGWSVIKACEACGSRSGATSQEVVVGGCGIIGGASAPGSSGGGGGGSSTAAAAAALPFVVASAGVSRLETRKATVPLQQRAAVAKPLRVTARAHPSAAAAASAAPRAAATAAAARAARFAF